jgi:hypothetical protein
MVSGEYGATVAASEHFHLDPRAHIHVAKEGQRRSQALT